MVNRWYVSDHHLAHYNIIAYGQRPFKDLADMHDYLLEMHNSVVKPQDHVSFLGDVTLKRGGKLDREWFIAEMKRYNGHKRLYLGNHDHFPTKVYLDAGFERIYATWRSDERVLWSHIPVHPRSLGTVIANVHGHIHQNLAYDPVMVNGKIVPYINVSVEAIAYKPVHLDEILAKIEHVKAEHLLNMLEMVNHNEAKL